MCDSSVQQEIGANQNLINKKNVYSKTSLTSSLPPSPSLECKVACIDKSGSEHPEHVLCTYPTPKINVKCFFKGLKTKF